ncbi:MAG: YgjV family protein [Ruminococcaceae bacterium]|nr:YgjV family protein [Oscillospiraceae bacterium]
MTPIEIAAQVISILGMAMNVLSFQQKNKNTVIFFQFFGGALFSVSFFMLSAPVGAIMNVIAVIRAVVYMNKEKFRSDSIIWVYVFTASFFISYALTFTLIGKEPSVKNLIVELLPIIGMIATTVSFRLEGAREVRRLGLISAPAWLTYNIFCFSLGGILCEAFGIISIFIGMIRFDFGKAKRRGHGDT